MRGSGPSRLRILPAPVSRHPRHPVVCQKLSCSDQIALADHGDLETFDLQFNTIAPCFLEIDPFDGSQNVDAARLDSDLKHDSRCGKVLFREIVERCPELRDGCPNSLDVFGRGTDPEIQVTRCPWQTVCREAVGSGQEELSLLRAQHGQHVSVVGIHQGALP